MSERHTTPPSAEERAVAETITDEERAEWRERETPVPVAPCRVCGTDLDLVNTNDHGYWAFACPSDDARESVRGPYRSDGHYNLSRTLVRQTDARIIRLLDALSDAEATIAELRRERERLTDVIGQTFDNLQLILARAEDPSMMPYPFIRYICDMIEDDADEAALACDRFAAADTPAASGPSGGEMSE